MLRSLFIPIVSFGYYFSRVMNVMYGSTLAARRVGLVEEAQRRMMNEPQKWGLTGLAPRLDPSADQRPLQIIASCALLPGEEVKKWSGVGLTTVPGVHRRPIPSRLRTE